MAELKKAIRRMKSRAAASPDDIPPMFLKNLGPLAMEELLAIFNVAFTTSTCPQVWRNALIVPLMKIGKPPRDLASYRPISLTSCIAKAMERMIADRLYHLAETNKWLNPQQAGFRKGRSCEDQITRIAQPIEDAFQKKPMMRFVLVLLDLVKHMTRYGERNSSSL